MSLSNLNEKMYTVHKVCLPHWNPPKNTHLLILPYKKPFSALKLEGNKFLRHITI